MRCPDCGNTNAADAAECEYCGQSLRPGAEVKRATVFERNAAAPAAPPDPIKRRTVYEPPPTGRPPAPPAQDPFAQPPPRRAVHDATDPFRAAMGAAKPTLAPATSEAVSVPPAVGQTPLRNPTIHVSPDVVKRPLGVLLGQSQPTDPGTLYVLREGRNVIGRDEGCEVRLTDGRVSGQHGFLFLSAGQARFIDVSTNGSLVDGEVVHGQQVELRSGAVLVVGATRLVFTPLQPVPPDAWSPS